MAEPNDSSPPNTGEQQPMDVDSEPEIVEEKVVAAASSDGQSAKVAEAVTRMKEKFSKISIPNAGDSSSKDENAGTVATTGAVNADKDEHPEGFVTIPLGRVKRIIRQDEEIIAVSSGALYSVAAATELFIKYLTEQAYMEARSNKRKKITYNDFAGAVSQNGELEFLQTLIPKAVPYKLIKERLKEGPGYKASSGKQTTILFGQKDD